jgi:formylglycine-generating enzyme required for sulfatase activity
MEMIEPEMVQITGGSFLMGSESGADDERPAHEVQLSPFSIGKYPVTNKQYQSFLESSGYLPVPLSWGDPHFYDSGQPVVGVSWFDALAFCEWLSNSTGKNYRLPTEAEWEYTACAGRPENTYPWGTRTWAEWPELHARFQNGPERVGLFKPNPWGIHDMGMNVHEWCADWYAADYYAVSPRYDASGPEKGTRRASRGGSWRHHVKITRCAARSSIPSAYRYADYGFRVTQMNTERLR